MGGGVGKGVQQDVEELPQEYLSSFVEESLLENIRLIELNNLEKHGSFPQYPKHQHLTRLLSDFTLDEYNDSFIVFISHCWLRARFGSEGWDGRPHPDNTQHSKFSLCIQGIRWIKQHLASRMKYCYIWIDYSCLPQSSDVSVKGGVRGSKPPQVEKARDIPLDRIIQICDCVFTPLYDPITMSSTPATDVPVTTPVIESPSRKGIRRVSAIDPSSIASILDPVLSPSSVAEKIHTVSSPTPTTAAISKTPSQDAQAPSEDSPPQSPPQPLLPRSGTFFSEYTHIGWNGSQCPFAYLSRSWCRLELFYAYYLPPFSLSLSLERLSKLDSAFAWHARDGRRPHFLYCGSVGRERGRDTSSTSVSPFIVPPLPKAWWDKYHPVHGNYSIRGDRDTLSRLIDSLKPYMTSFWKRERVGFVGEYDVRTGQREGESGACRYENGDLYEGGWSKGRYEGQGKQTNRDSKGRLAVYEGQFHRGKRHGFGRLSLYPAEIVSADSLSPSQCLSHYEGHWARGRRHGHGQCKYPNGDVYEGDWVDDEMHGRGRYVFADSDVYEGLFQHDVKCGEGQFTFADGGDVITGDFRDGEYVGPSSNTTFSISSSFSMSASTHVSTYKGRYTGVSSQPNWPGYSEPGISVPIGTESMSGQIGTTASLTTKTAKRTSYTGRGSISLLSAHSKSTSFSIANDVTGPSLVIMYN